MENTRDLKVEPNYISRLFERLSQQTVIAVIAVIALIVSGLALGLSTLIASKAWENATYARVQVDYELKATREELARMKNQYALTSVYLQENHMKMEAAGLNPVPLPEAK